MGGRTDEPPCLNTRGLQPQIQPAYSGDNDSSTQAAAPGDQKMSTAREFGSGPTTRDLVDKLIVENADLRRAVTELSRRIEVLEEHGGDDGRAPPPLSPNWRPVREAAALLGFSQSGLRKHLKHWDAHAGYVWWTYRGGRLFVDIDAAPIREVRT
jgi:hypothetical protein